MNISFVSIGIEVAEAVVEAISSEVSPDAPLSRATGVQRFPPILHHFRAEVSVIFEAPDRPEGLLADAVHRAQARGAEIRVGEALPPSLADTGRLGLKGVLARSALLALPALAVWVAPRIARAALAAAKKNGLLGNWVRGFLAAPQPRLPPAP